MNDWLELAIIAFIVLTIGWHVVRTARANPEDTGTLGLRLESIGGKLAAIKLEVDDTDRRLTELEKSAAKVHDIKRVEKAIEGLDRTLDRVVEDSAMRASTLEHVKEQVDRLYRVIVEKGMGK